MDDDRDWPIGKLAAKSTAFYTFGGYVEDESPKLNSVIDDELDDIEEGVNIWELGRYA